MSARDLPELYMPFAARLNPHVDGARRHSRAWAEQMGMFTEEHGTLVWHESGFDHSDFALFAALTHPDAEAAELAIATDWHVWSWYFDDYFVEVFKRRRDRDGARAFVDRLAAFMPLVPGVTPPPANVVEHALSDVWQRTGPFLPWEDRAQFAEGIVTMARSWLWELDNLVHDRVPDPIDYIETRRTTGGAELSTRTALLGLRVRIPAEVLRAPAFQALTDTFTDAVDLINDIMSYRREVEYEGEINNAVLITERFLDCGLPEAVEVVNRLLTTRVRAFEGVIETDLPALLDETDLRDDGRVAVLTYAHGLRDLMAGVAAWSRDTPRYHDASLWTGRPGAVTVDPPPNFPADIPLRRRTFRNWSGETEVTQVWAATPSSGADVVTVANWAREHGWRLRASGKNHSWSPLVIQPADAGKVVLLDTARLTSVTVTPGAPASVTAQTGVTMEDLLAQLETAGYGLSGYPESGNLTLGGVLAVDAHGRAVPAAGETRIPGQCFGTLSNLVLELTAVVWDQRSGRYALRTFARSAPETAALLTHLGRAFVVDAKLQIGANYRLRCQSIDNIPASRLFAAPDEAGPDSFAAWVDRVGRFDVAWWAFTDTPWLKVYSVEPTKPATSREVRTPYNYPFMDVTSLEASQLLAKILAGHQEFTPAFQAALVSSLRTGLTATASRDMWGWSKNVMLTSGRESLRVTTLSCTVLTSRAEIQRVVNDFYVQVTSMIYDHALRGEYPVNGRLAFRVTGTDDPDEIEFPNAVSPQLSAARPRPDHPEWDVMVWMDLLTTPGGPGTQQFYHDLEQWAISHFNDDRWALRMEWAKCWGFSGTSPWANKDVLEGSVPDSYRAGQSPTDNWDTAVTTLDSLDPHRVFTNLFLDDLLGHHPRRAVSSSPAGSGGRTTQLRPL
jgi:FAD/FMN-containing dehydrogenase